MGLVFLPGAAPDCLTGLLMEVLGGLVRWVCPLPRHWSFRDHGRCDEGFAGRCLRSRNRHRRWDQVGTVRRLAPAVLQELLEEEGLEELAPVLHLLVPLVEGLGWSQR